jgi:hypothetical protein
MAVDQTDRAEEQLRAALHARAAQVSATPPAYGKVSAVWRRRERKRRLILAILAALVFTTADGVALWALNHANTDSHIIFSDPKPAERPIGGLTQP